MRDFISFLFQIAALGLAAVFVFNLAYLFLTLCGVVLRAVVLFGLELRDRNRKPISR